MLSRSQAISYKKKVDLVFLDNSLDWIQVYPTIFLSVPADSYRIIVFKLT